MDSSKNEVLFKKEGHRIIFELEKNQQYKLQI